MTTGIRLANAAPEDAALPQLQDALLDPETLEQLFRDIQRCVVVDEVLLKGGAALMASEKSVPLTEAEQALREKRVVGVQIRYWYEGDELVGHADAHASGRPVDPHRAPARRVGARFASVDADRRPCPGLRAPPGPCHGARTGAVDHGLGVGAGAPELSGSRRRTRPS